MIAPLNHQSYSTRQSPTRHEAWEIASSRLEAEAKPDERPIGLTDKLTDTVGQHPLVALAAASAIGIAAGWLLKRKL